MDRSPHIPVLLAPILTLCAPISGLWVDGTFGAGGYSRGLLEAGASVIGIDRDPLAHRMAEPWAKDYPKLRLEHGTFSDLDAIAGEKVDGVVLDLGVSSMQIDQAERGFSFQKDGPLDMRMSQEGESAADLVNGASEAHLADVLFHFGEERAARRIARAIVEARAKAPFETTLQLAEVISRCLPRPKPGQSHPATRAFQGLRIAVNAEFDQLAQGLAAAERALKPGGLLAVVTFHSLEDRVVKRYFQQASGQEGNANRYAPATTQAVPRFTLVTRKAVEADEAELALNPRARSARLRIARRTEAPAKAPRADDIDLPQTTPQSRKKSR